MLHNDDTGLQVLHLAREPSDERTGVFTSGVESVAGGRRIALFFTGRQHAGENLADVLRHWKPLTLFRGVPSWEWNDIREVVGPTFTF